MKVFSFHGVMLAGLRFSRQTLQYPSPTLAFTGLGRLVRV
jgi:hypothetical protein